LSLVKPPTDWGGVGGVRVPKDGDDNLDNFLSSASSAAGRGGFRRDQKGDRGGTQNKVH